MTLERDTSMESGERRREAERGGKRGRGLRTEGTIDHRPAGIDYKGEDEAED